ncbi:MAG: hypothetical protein KDA28_04135 [Phycisphaerales bacterium]|nr:hypothetical protein [Phycisphaerales bacterium]
MGSSLLSGSEFDDIGVKGGGSKKGGGSNGDTVKLVAAIALIVCAGALLAWHFGVIDVGGKPVVQPTQDQVDAFKEQKAKTDELILNKSVTEAGS